MSVRRMNLVKISQARSSYYDLDIFSGAVQLFEKSEQAYEQTNKRTNRITIDPGGRDNDNNNKSINN